MCSKIVEFERYHAISQELLNTQTQDKYQHVAKSLKILLMLILWRLQLVWRQYGKKRQIYHPIGDRIGLAHVQLRPWVSQSSYHYENILQIGEILGHRIDAIISPKAASEKVWTTVSGNRYTYPKIDVFSDGHFNAYSDNGRQCVGIIFGTPGTACLRYSLAVSPNV